MRRWRRLHLSIDEDVIDEAWELVKELHYPSLSMLVEDLLREAIAAARLVKELNAKRRRVRNTIFAKIVDHIMR